MRSWLITQPNKSETAILRCERIIVEWMGIGYKAYFLRYL